MSTQAQQHKRSRTAAEWVSLGIALLLLTGVIGAIISLWVQSGEEDARFRVTTAAPREVDGQFYLPITVSNEGDTTASQVLVEGTLLVDGAEEQASTTFDFVPGHAQVEAVLIFSAEPSAAEVRVMSYQAP